MATAARPLLERAGALLLLLLLSGCLGRASSPPAPVVSGSDRGGYYTVQPGDTIYSIAWGLEMDYLVLARRNGLRRPYRLRAGQRLRLDGWNGEGRRRPADSRPEGVIRREVIPEFLDLRGEHQEVPEPRGALRWQWPAWGEVERARSGIEIKGEPGVQVRAVEIGHVVYSGDGLKGYGNLVIIEHRNSYLSAYGFNRKLLVKEGDRVVGGTPIAEMGVNRGVSSLYFEIRKGTTPQDPLGLLPARARM